MSLYKEFLFHANSTVLYCRSYGTGTPLLLIHGSCVDSDFWMECAEYLAENFRVITYDRHGYGRSEDPTDENHSVAAQAADVASLIQSLGEPCYLAAHSAGAAIALELAAVCPEMLKKVILYEPFIYECLREAKLGNDKETPSGKEVSFELDAINDLVEQKKYLSALDRFMRTLGPRDDRARSSTAEELDHMERNMNCFIRKEFREISFYLPHYELLNQNKIIIGVGELSRKSHHWLIAAQLSKKLDCPLMYFPGSHNCAYDLPCEFACMVIGILNTKQK